MSNKDKKQQKGLSARIAEDAAAAKAAVVEAPAEVAPGLVITTPEALAQQEAERAAAPAVENNGEANGEAHDLTAAAPTAETPAAEAPVAPAETPAVDAHAQETSAPANAEAPATEAPATTNGATNGATNGTDPAAKLKTYMLKLTEPQLTALNYLVQLGGGLATEFPDDFKREEAAHDLLALLTKSKTSPSAVADGLTIWGFSTTALLHWMGANGFNTYDAKNFLLDHGAPEDFRKDVIASALAKGKKPANERKVKLINLDPEQEVLIMDYYCLAQRQAAEAANKARDAAKAKLLAAKANGAPAAAAN